MQRYIANLPLHTGKCPIWLFSKMKKLSRYIIIFIIEKYNTKKLIQYLSNPYWFQSLGSLLGFDWHSSGLTTTLTAALKESIKDIENDLNLFIVGGKGKTALKTPEEIIKKSYKYGFNFQNYINISKLTAKIDNSLIQDGYNLYHHTLIFDKYNNWTVIQQGLNEKTQFARRYHWYSNKIKNFLLNPHSGIITYKKLKPLNLIDKQSQKTQKSSILLLNEKPEFILNNLKKLKEYNLPKRHQIYLSDINFNYLKKITYKLKEKPIYTYKDFVLTKGVGLKTIRAITLLADLLYGSKVSFKDPATFSFAHGGKDAIPYPVDLKTYDSSINILKETINKFKHKVEKNKTTFIIKDARFH